MSAGTEGYAALVAARAPALLRLAVMLTGSRVDAEDLVQATLVRTQRHADRIAVMAAPAAYLRRAMVHEHLPGFHADGRDPDEGPDGGIGGSSLAGGGWSNDVYFYAPGDDSAQGGAGIQVQTTQMGDRTGVRTTIFGTW